MHCMSAQCSVCAARERIQELASKNSKFKAVDRAIGRNSLKVRAMGLLVPCCIWHGFELMTLIHLEVL